MRDAGQRKCRKGHFGISVAGSTQYMSVARPESVLHTWYLGIDSISLHVSLRSTLLYAHLGHAIYTFMNVHLGHVVAEPTLLKPCTREAAVGTNWTYEKRPTLMQRRCSKLVALRMGMQTVASYSGTAVPAKQAHGCRRLTICMHTGRSNNDYTLNVTRYLAWYQ